MAKKNDITAVQTQPGLTLNLDEVKLILAYRAMDVVHQTHMSKISVALADYAPRQDKPTLRLIGGGAK